MRKILNNKFLRLLTTVVFAIVIYLLFSVLPAAVMGENFADIADEVSIMLALTIVEALLLQLLGDVLNSDKWNSGFLGLLKRILFTVLAVLGVIVGIALTWSDIGSNIGVFATALARTSSFACPLLCAAWLVASSKGMSAKTAPFYMPAAMVASFLLGILFACIGSSSASKQTANVIITLIDIALLVAMIVWRIKVGAEFSDYQATASESFNTPRTTTKSSSVKTAQSDSDKYYKFQTDLDRALRLITAGADGIFLSDGSELLISNKVNFFGKHALFTLSVDSDFPDGSNPKVLEEAQKEYVRIANDIKTAAETELTKLKKKYALDDYEYRIEVSLDEKYSGGLTIDDLIAETERRNRRK